MNKIVFFVSPLLRIFLMLMFLPLVRTGGPRGQKVGLLFFLCLLSFNVYPLIGAGWSSNRKFAFLGRLRAVAQTIAYEIRLAFLLLRLFLIKERRYLGEELRLSLRPGYVYFFLPLAILWGVTCVAELNRTPFDFAEGESELVSGFNVEYGSVKFAIIFIAEYGIIYFLSVLTVYLFLSPCLRKRSLVIGSVRLSALVVWLRATLPRYRYDLLLNLTWKKILPRSLLFCQLRGAAVYLVG